MFILWQICKNYVELLQVVVHNVSALCNCINDVLYVARIKKNSHNLINDFRSANILRGYLARDFIFFGVRTKYLAHIGAKKFEFMGTICLKSLIEHYLKKESFKICFFPFEITQLKKINE